MVYAAEIGDRELSLGVSGRLLEGNLVMWDPETNSLWSQILGQGIHGELEGRRLEMLPAVFVGFGTWKKMHPATQVLDMSPVRATSWYYTTENLAEARNERGERLGIGVRKEAAAAVIPLAVLHERRLVNLKVGSEPVVIVWLEDEKAALAYSRRIDGEIIEPAWREGRLVDADRGRSWDPLTGASAGQEAPPLARFPYVPTTLSAWTSYYPRGEVVGR